MKCLPSNLYIARLVGLMQKNSNEKEAKIDETQNHLGKEPIFSF